MSCPMMHDIPVGALLPLLKRSFNYKTTNIEFHDYFPEIYKRFGIDRAEMMVILPAVSTVDVLTGFETLKYIGENE